MIETSRIQTPNLKFRKTIARTYLYEDRLKDAVEIFLGILQEAPEDADTLLELGNLYLASGNGKTAVRLFRRVLELAPERTIIKKQLELAANEDESDLPEEPVPTDPEAISRLLQRLTGENEPILEREIVSAYEMLQKIMSSPCPGDEVANSLDEIGKLLPALIELNIRQARADGKTAVAEALQNVQINIALQKETRDEETVDKTIQRKVSSIPVRRRLKANVLILLPDISYVSDRVAFVYNALRQSGCKVTLAEEFQIDATAKASAKADAKAPAQPDIVIVSNPHLKPYLSQCMALCSASGIPLIVDLDMDFENLPIFHPDYAAKGLGTVANSKAYTASLLLANKITVPSQAMADSLRASGYPVAVVPEGWHRGIHQRQKLAPARNEIYIGWVGTSRLLEDLATIRRVIIRVLYEFENTKVVIIGNSPAYQLLSSVPQNRKIFLPTSSQDAYLSLLEQLDILLVPLRSHPFNNAQSDKILIESGARSIPWIASSIPAFVDWGAGGLIANTREEWHTYLRQLVMDPALRTSLGKEGFQAANKREAKYLGNVWVSTVEQVMTSEQKNAIQ